MQCAQVRAPVGQGVSVVQGGSKRLQEPNWKEQRGVTFGLHSYADTLDCIVSFLTSPHRSPCTIRSCAFVCVRCDLTSCSCMIRSGGSLVYDINLGATATTILSTRGVQIPIDLVSSATDSLGDA